MLIVFWSWRQFLEPSSDNHGSPRARVLNFFELDTNERIGSHPIYFLPSCGEAIKISIFESEISWCDIGLIGLRTCQAAKARPPQDLKTVLMAHLLDFHAWPLSR